MKEKERYAFLDILRCLALIMILYDHLGPFYAPEWTIAQITDTILFIPLHIIQYSGALGVSLFFAISGFLAAKNADDEKLIIKKLPYKILKLYIPLLISFITFYIYQRIISFIQPGFCYWKQFTGRQWFLGGTLLGYFEGTGDLINGSTWFLVPTFYFYLISTIFAKYIKRRPFVGLLSMESTIFVLYLLDISNFKVIINACSFLWYLTIPVGGMIIYFIWKRQLKINEAFIVIAANYLVMIFGIYRYSPNYITPDSYGISIIYAFFILICGIAFNHIYQPKGNKLISKLATLSYYIYLVHTPYGSHLMGILRPHVPYTIVFLCCVIFAFLVAVIHYHLCNKILILLKIL